MDLTLCLIVKNEGRKLSNCLSSFQRLYQKLVVIDTGSTDNTKKIVKQFGGTIYDFIWDDNFSKARNFALSKVQTSWVMMVDADDYMDQTDLKKLQEEMQKLPPKVLGIFLPYIYSAVNQGNGVMAYLPKIWRTDKKFQYTLPVHEYLDIPRQDLSLFHKFKFPIIHNKNANNFHKGYSRNLYILENAYKIDQSQKRIVFYLGHDNQYAGNYADAIKWYCKYLLLKDKHPDEEHKAYVGKGLCYLKLNHFSKAKTAFLKAININSAFIEPYIFLGDLAMKEQNYVEAVQIFFRALSCQPPNTHVFTNTNLYNGFVLSKLAEALCAIENLKKA